MNSAIRLEDLHAGVSADGGTVIEVLHYIPADDDREHVPSTECWCEPKQDKKFGVYCFVHTSADGREAFETGERLPS
jgi:hypothetical protein